MCAVNIKREIWKQSGKLKHLPPDFQEALLLEKKLDLIFFVLLYTAQSLKSLIIPDISKDREKKLEIDFSVVEWLGKNGLKKTFEFSFSVQRLE